MTIYLIEVARANEIHLLFLPAHCTHILQPLDVGVFDSFKFHLSKACHTYYMKHPDKVITPDVLASLVAEAYPHSIMPLDTRSGFRKCGMYSINPGAVSNSEVASSGDPSFIPSSPPFTSEQQALHEPWFKEGYDLLDPNYMVWLNITYPGAVFSDLFSKTASLVSEVQTRKV